LLDVGDEAENWEIPGIILGAILHFSSDQACASIGRNFRQPISRLVVRPRSCSSSAPSAHSSREYCEESSAVKVSKTEQRIYFCGANTTRPEGLLRDPLMRIARDVDTKIVLYEAADDFNLRNHKSNKESIFAAQMKSL
jgi:hypothetical protein